MPEWTTPWSGVRLMMGSISLEVIPTLRKTMEEDGALFKEMICISTQGRQTLGKNLSLAARFLHAERSTLLCGARKMMDSMFLEAIPTATTRVICICIHGKEMNGNVCIPLVPLLWLDIYMPSWGARAVSTSWEGATAHRAPMMICFCTHGRPRPPQRRTHHRRRQARLLLPQRLQA